MYASIPFIILRIFDWVYLPFGAGVFFLSVFIFTSLYTLLRRQKAKDIIAYYLLKSSEFFQAYSSENEPKDKARFLEECLSNIRQFGRNLEKTLENARVSISLDLPNLTQLKLLQENVMNRIYPMVQDGHNTDDDILLSLSKIFFYENEYDRLPDLNSAMEKTFQKRTFEEKHEGFLARARQNTIFKCAISDIGMILLIFGGIYILRYPIEPSAYWIYLGNNAATIVGAIAASTLGVILFFHRGKPR